MANPLSQPFGAYGYADFQTKIQGIDLEFETSAAVTAKRVVALGTTGKVANAATDSTASLCVGIALHAAASGDLVKVRVFGAVDDVPTTGSLSASGIIKRSVTTTGSIAVTASPAAGEALGFAIADSASNVTDVFVCKSL